MNFNGKNKVFDCVSFFFVGKVAFGELKGGKGSIFFLGGGRGMRKGGKKLFGEIFL